MPILKYRLLNVVEIIGVLVASISIIFTVIFYKKWRDKKSAPSYIGTHEAFSLDKKKIAAEKYVIAKEEEIIYNKNTGIPSVNKI